MFQLGLFFFGITGFQQIVPIFGQLTGMSPFDKLMFLNIQYPVFDGRKKIPPEGFLQTDRFPVVPDIDKYILYRILGFTLFVQISPGIKAQDCIIL